MPRNFSANRGPEVTAYEIASSAVRLLLPTLKKPLYKSTVFVGYSFRQNGRLYIIIKKSVAKKGGILLSGPCQEIPIAKALR
jgi:hypothetical protein